jgi:hypothetical protein
MTRQADAALAHLDEFVQKTETVSKDGNNFAVWRDAASRRECATTYLNGRLNKEIVTSADQSRKVTVLVVDHVSRAWWTYRMDDGPATPPAGARPVGDPADPATIRAAISNGDLQILGHDRVDGRDTLRLRLTPRPQKKEPAYQDIWVDAASYLPLQTIMLAGGYSATTTFTWLPRTPANLANLDLVPPAGYTHRGGPPADPRPTGAVG